MQPAITIGAPYALVVRDGDRIVSMSSQDTWYRLLRALADLFIAGEIDAERSSGTNSRGSSDFSR